jgi:hypothetical protein
LLDAEADGLKAGLAILVSGVIAAHAAAGAELDKAKLDEARSLLAEAAALEHAQAGHRVGDTYAEGLRGDLRKDLQKLLKAPAFADVARAGLSALDRHDAAALALLRDRLVALERSHGRAG